MTTTRETANLRTAVITELARRASTSIGRTAIMKLTYFLQTLRDAELGYSFRLYNYGPYDGQVLEDLKIAEQLGGVHSEEFEWQGGSGYEIKPGVNADDVVKRAKQQLETLSGDIDWVVKEFANRSASDLEVASTAIYVDRSLRPQKLSIEDLVARVHAIKRHHSISKIDAEIRRLNDKRFLESIGSEH